MQQRWRVQVLFPDGTTSLTYVFGQQELDALDAIGASYVAEPL